MAPVLSSVPLVRVRVIRTANNLIPAGQRLKATPTVKSLSVAGQHGFIDPLEDRTSILEQQTGVDYFDLVATDDDDVAEAFGWTISLLGSTRAARTVSVPQSGPIVEQITVTDGAQTYQMPAVWLHQLADFTGPSGPVGPEIATRTYVDDSLAALQDAADPFPQYAMDGEGGGSLLSLAADPLSMLTGTVTPNPVSLGMPLAGPVVWPDGRPGTYSATTVNSTVAPGAVDAYTVTYVPASGPTKTFTQPAVSRNSTTGNVTNRPAIVES